METANLPALVPGYKMIPSPPKGTDALQSCLEHDVRFGLLYKPEPNASVPDVFGLIIALVIATPCPFWY